jgi:hypothetical protein
MAMGSACMGARASKSDISSVTPPKILNYNPAMKKMRSVAIYLLLIVALPGLLIGQEEGGQDSVPAVIPAAAKERLARLLPEPSEVGAARTGEQKFYSSGLYK